MFINFETNEISERDARCLIALLEPIAGLQVEHPIKDAVRNLNSEKPAITPQPEMTTTEIVETAKKRGRPRKEQPTEVAVVDPTPTTPETSSEATSVTAEPFTLEDLREAVNDHVARKGMGSAMEIIKAAGCPRVTAVMDLELAHQQKVVAELKK